MMLGTRARPRRWYVYTTIPMHYLTFTLQMAKAGFIYVPVNNKDDTCECIYCGIELAGWEPEDDPMYVFPHSYLCLPNIDKPYREEHRSRQAKRGPCSFFASSSDISEPTKRVRSKSKPPPITPIASSSDQEYHPPGTRSSTRPPSSKKPVGSAKSKASAKPSKKSTRTKKTIEEEVVAEYRITLDADEDAPPKPRPKPRRAKSRSRSRPRASSTQSTVADETDIDMSSSVSSAPATTPQPQVESFHEPEDVPPVSPVVALSLSKSFRSPEDEEFAREEQALEEQARQLMLTDTTFSLASSLPHGEKSDVTKSQREGLRDTDPHSALSVDKGKGKGKAKTSTGEDSMIAPSRHPRHLPVQHQSPNQLFPPL
jgi:Inhibitor of Apoptosis domain